jgi:hypothetical protein
MNHPHLGIVYGCERTALTEELNEAAPAAQ